MDSHFSNGRSAKGRYARSQPESRPDYLCRCGWPVSARDRKAGKTVCLWCRLAKPVVR